MPIGIEWALSTRLMISSDGMKRIIIIYRNSNLLIVDRLVSRKLFGNKIRLTGQSSIVITDSDIKSGHFKTINHFSMYQLNWFHKFIVFNFFSIHHSFLTPFFAIISISFSLFFLTYNFPSFPCSLLIYKLSNELLIY